MRIIFNAMNVGIGQNGGSHTIVQSANTLSSLGNDVTIIDTGKNQYTFDTTLVEHIKVRRPEDVPNADVIIGTGFRSWQSTIDFPKRCGKKFIWLRGWETWNAPENRLFDLLSNKKITVLANSVCLTRKLSERGIIPWLIRPGNDFDKFSPLNKRDPEIVVFGGLYNSGNKRSTKRTEWIYKTYETLKKEYAGGLRLAMFGCENGSPKIPVNIYMHNPHDVEKNDLYNMVDIWLAPSELEGLHIPPQEAMLTECCVLGTCAPMSGMQDYLIDGKTGVVSDNNINDFINKARDLVHSSDMRKHYGHEGKLKIRSLGDRIDNMKKLINTLGANI